MPDTPALCFHTAIGHHGIAATDSTKQQCPPPPFASTVDVTYKLLLNHGGWRAHVLRRGYIPEADVARPLAANTIFLPGRDREGRALIIVKVANHDARRRDLREMKLFSIYIMESMVALCDRAANPQCRLASMFDLTGCSYHNLDAAVMRNILGILSAHYVERLSVMYFYNAPAVFFAIWNASKGLLPEVTRNKIKMISPSDTSELRAWLPDDVLPAEYGGQGELLPIAAACRRFRLPPFDGLVDPSVPVPAPAHDAGGDTAAAARADGSGSGGGGAEEDGGSSDDGEVVFEDCHEDHEWAAAAADEKGGGAAAAAAREAVMVAA